jgi:hypothetical protein
MAEIVTPKQLVEQLEHAAFVIMKRTPGIDAAGARIRALMKKAARTAASLALFLERRFYAAIAALFRDVR